MARYLLDVPVVAQSQTMSCWHAAAEMIWFYSQKQTKRHGPMFTLISEWVANSGVTVSDFVRLAKAVGLKAVPRKPTYSSTDIVAMLKQFGPLWCAGIWYGVGHIVVLTGIDNQTVFINDPDCGVKKTGSVTWFNQKLCNTIDGCLMFKDPKAY